MVDLNSVVDLANSTLNVVTDQVVTPILILLIGVAIGKIVHKTLEKTLGSIEFDKHASSILGQPATLTELISGGVATVIYTVATVWALHQAQILVETLLFIAGFLGIVVLLALLLYVRDAMPNITASIALRKRFVKKQVVHIANVSGRVEVVGHLGLTVVSEDGLEYYLPWVCVRQN